VCASMEVVCVVVGPRENMGCSHDAEMETDESELSFPLDMNSPKYELP
jgi:hypothetical protein